MGNQNTLGKHTPRLIAGITALLLTVALAPTLTMPAHAADGAGTVANDGYKIHLDSSISIDSVRTITFSNTIPTTGTCWNAGVYGYESTVVGCATASIEDSSLYDVTYGANGAYPKFPANSSGLFGDFSIVGHDFSNLVAINNLNKIDTSNVTNMSCMFGSGAKLQSLDVSNFNTTNVTNMSRMFTNCLKLTELDVSNFNTSKVTNMNEMFWNCQSLTSLDVSNFNTSNVTAMSSMFFYCSKLSELDVSNFNTSKVTDMSGMFMYCSSLTSLDVSNFNTSNVTNIGYMLFKLSSLQTLKLGANFTKNPGTDCGLGVPYAPAKTGYSATGKWKNDTTNVAYIAAGIPTKTAATYVADYEPNTYTVTFKPNEGSGTMNAQSFTYGEAAKALTANTFTRTGYRFTGWNTQAGGNGTAYTDKQAISPTSSLTLYAQWEASTYTITYESNGGSGAMSKQTFTSGDSVTLTANTFTRTGYHFTGWKTQATGGTGYSDKATITPTGNLTLYAQWDANTYTVQFAKNADDATGSMESQSFTYDTAQPLTGNTFKRAGYTFTGWKDTAGKTYTDKQSVSNLTATSNGTVSLSAQWTANTDTKYTVQHFKQALDGTYPTTPDNTDTLTGVTGADTKAIAKTTYTGFTPGTVTQQKIKGDGSTVVTIKYTRNSYTVSFDANGHGTAPTAQSNVKYGAKLTEPTAPSVDGYTFDGWYTDKTCTSKWDFATSTIPAQNVTLYSKWTANTYTVKFAVNGGSGSMNTQTFTYDKAQNLTVSTLTRDGYTFTGWKDETGKTYSDGQSVENLTPTNNGVVTLTAQWDGNATSFTFDTNGGTGSMPIINGKVGEQCKLTVSTLTRDGYTFTGWNTSKDGKGTAYADGATVPYPTSPLTLYAQWTANASKIAYNANGGTGTMQDTTGVTDQKVTVGSNAYERDGYTFTGWNTKSDGSGDSLTAGGQYTLKATPTVLYAQWTGNTYTITYDTNGGTLPADAPKTHVYGGETKLPTPSRDGYSFDGWYDEQDSKIDSIPADAKDVKVTAKWTGNTYTITYDPNGGTLPADAPKTHIYGGETKLPTPTRDGYTFDGWYDEQGNKIDSIPADAKDMKVTAKWTANEYTITYDPNGGTLPEDAPKTHVYGEETNLPTPSRDGYTFDGWYDEQGNKLDSIPADAKDMKVTARWSGNTYDITYDPNGGILPSDAPKTHTYGEETKLPTPTRDGYTFDGWYDENGNKVDSIPADAKAIKIIARWKAITPVETLAQTGATLNTIALIGAGLITIAVGILIFANARRKKQ